MNAPKTENYILCSARNNLKFISEKLDKMIAEMPPGGISDDPKFENEFLETIKQCYQAQCQVALLEKIYNDENND